MNRKLWAKLLATMLVMTLTLTNFMLLGVYAGKSYGVSDNLEGQQTLTNNENVTFDAYFMKNEGQHVHTVKENMNKEDLKLYVAIGVKKGYLKDASIQVLGENKTTSNISVKNSNDDFEYIESVDEANNIIYLKQVNTGTQVVLAIPVVASKSDVYDLSNFSKLNNIVFTGNYVGDAGRETKLLKTIQVRNEWTAEAKAMIEQQLLRFIPYEINNQKGTVLQTLVKSGVANNALPVKETTITLEAPLANGKKPTHATVIANGIFATNGKAVLNENDWNYNQETGMVTIVLKNEAVENKVSWLKQVQDELIVTYVYDEKVDTIETVAKAETTIKAYNMGEASLQANHELTISQNEVLGQIVSGNVEVTDTLSKGSLYQKTQKDTIYEENVTVDISNPELVNTIVLRQEMDYFVNEEGEMLPTTIGNANYAYYKTTKINANNFKTILGEEGNIKIETLAGEKIITLNKDVKPDENGDYVINYETEVNQIRIIASKPIKAGKLIVRHEKALKGNIDYTKEQIENFRTLKVKLEVEAKAENISNVTTSNRQNVAEVKLDTVDETVNTNEIVVSKAQALKEITLVEPTTKIETSVSNENLSTIVKNENVELRVVLKTNDITCDLYKNPSIEIVLPTYVEKVDIKDINLLFDNELTIKNYHMDVNENGNTVIRVNLEGEQTNYSSDEISKGANLIINTDITLKQLTPTKEDVMEVYVTNELATSYEQTKKTPTREVQKGYSETSLKAVAPVGIVTTTSLSGYNEKNETITSVGANEQIGKLDVKKQARTANVGMTIINNYPNKVNQMVVLGRVLSNGSVHADSLEDFNSNLATSMNLDGITWQMQVPENTGNTGVIEGTHIGSTILYYSENPSATKDLTVPSNGWKQAKDVQDYSKIKSYLVVGGEEIPTGTIMNMNYSIQIPENVGYNMGAYGNYVVYFNNITEEGAVSEKVVSAKVGLSTGEGPELEVKLHSDREGKEVQEGEIITYTVEVKNIGKSEAKNVNVFADVPEKTIYTYMQMVEGEGASNERMYDAQMKAYREVIETIAVGETKTLTYQVEAGDLSVGYDQNGNIQTVEDYTIQNNAKVTVEGYDAEFVANTVENKLIQGYVKVRMEVATIPEQYARAEGDEVTYVIYVENTNFVEKKNITLKTTLPEGYTYIGSTGFGNYDETTRQLTWNIENLAGNATLRYQFGVTVDSLPSNIYEKTINTKAQLLGEKQVESNEVSINVKKAKLTIKQSSDTKSQIAEGDTIIYNFVVKNEGKGDAPSVEVIDELPEGLVYESAQYSYNGKTYDSNLGNANRVRVTIGGLKPGETLEISLKAIAQKLEDGVNKKQVTNKASVTANGVESVVSNEIVHTIVPNKNNPSKDPSIDIPEEGTHSISGIIWLDANGNGKREEEEPRRANIPVILINADNGQIVKDSKTGKDKKQETNAQGEYVFANLKPGKYMVVFLYDSGNYGVTHYKQEGVNDDQNSDAVQMKVVYEEVERIGAVSDKLALSNQNIMNIDLGLITSPKFDLKLDKMVTRITVSDVNGTDVYDYKDEKVAKLDLKDKTAVGSTVMIEYKIKVTNEGGVAGYAKKIVDYLPSDMKFSSELNKDWYTGDNGTNLYNASLANTLIKPGETKEITLLLTRKITNSNMGIVHNTAEIAESYNDLGLVDIDSKVFNKVQSEDDYSSADVIIGIKTGEIYVYILLSITVITLLGVGIYFINKKVLKR